MLLIYLLIITNYVSVGAQIDPPVITQELQDESGLEYFSIAFICKASGRPAPTFEWMRDSRKASNTRYTIVPIHNGSIMWIEPLKTRDTSEYSCIASNPGGEARSSANLVVYTADSLPRGFPEITSAPRLSAVEKHDQAVMSCAAVGNPDPEIIWFRDMAPVDTSSDRIQIRDSSTIVIDNADETDQGKYQCAARNAAGTRYSYAAALYVRERRVPPHFTIEPANYEVVPGGSVNLTCVAVGSPMPMVKWTHGGQDLTTVELPIGRNVLQLTSVEETGEYTCVAMSSLGTIQTSATVTVRRPESPFELCYNETAQQEGQISSPNYPANYPSSRSCSTTITAGTGQVVYLVFQELLLETGSGGCSDSLSLYDGNSTESPRLFGICALRPYVLGGYRSTGRYLTLLFSSDADSNYKGFLANVTFIQPESCDVIMNQEGQISSPNYPSIYDNISVCRTTITAGIGQIVQLIFQDFMTGPSSSCSSHSDTLSLYDGNSDTSQSRGRFCGTISPGVITSTGRSIHLVFESGVALPYKGFLADVQFLPERIVPPRFTMEPANDEVVPGGI